MLNRTELEGMGETNPGRITGKPYPPFSIARGEHVQQCNEWASAKKSSSFARFLSYFHSGTLPDRSSSSGGRTAVRHRPHRGAASPKK
jgi:hypothetical protein